MDQVNTLFTAEQQLSIENAISVAELNTSGEIRVHLEGTCEGNVLDRAAQVFSDLDMHKTELRNGVLIYLAVRDHKFAVIGDAGINAKVPKNFWDDVKIKMQIRFRAGNFTEGLIEAIISAGEHLKKHFPYESNDVNELSNKISFGDA
jgi:uncharacterized membrane protein